MDHSPKHFQASAPFFKQENPEPLTIPSSFEIILTDRLPNRQKTASMKKKRLRLFPLALLFSLFLHAQQNAVITGTVTNSKTGEALEGVTITVNKQTTGTTSKADGTYSITVNADSRVLSFSSVGYLKQSVEIDGKTKI